MKESQESFFYGGIDTDSTERAIAQGDYRTALYARSGNASEGEDGALVSMTGNLLYENVDLPAGTNTVIGSCPWVEANSIIFFVHNSNDDHSIFQYDTTDNSFTLVLTDALLNLQIANKIVGARVVNGILYWTDGYFESYLKNVDGIWQFNPPRNLNIQAAIDATYTTTEQLLDFIKYPSFVWVMFLPWFFRVVIADVVSSFTVSSPLYLVWSIKLLLIFGSIGSGFIISDKCENRSILL